MHAKARVESPQPDSSSPRQSRLRCGCAALGVGLLAALLLVPAGASGQTGGATSPSGGSTSTWTNTPFGSRDLRMGMRGDDVRTLNWILRAQLGAVPLYGQFEQPTDARVRTLQAHAGIARTGVVNHATRRAMTRFMRARRATWYGPGLWGNRTACGQVLRPRTMGVAHKRLPCGTRVTLAFRGRYVRTRVIDRGPFRRGYTWDLTRRTANRIGFLRAGKGRVRAAIIRRRR